MKGKTGNCWNNSVIVCVDNCAQQTHHGAQEVWWDMRATWHRFSSLSDLIAFEGECVSSLYVAAARRNAGERSNETLALKRTLEKGKTQSSTPGGLIRQSIRGMGTTTIFMMVVVLTSLNRTNNSSPLIMQQTLFCVFSRLITAAFCFTCNFYIPIFETLTRRQKKNAQIPYQGQSKS